MHLVALAHRDADGGVVDNVEMEEVGPEHVVEAEPATPAAAVQHQVVDSDVLGGGACRRDAHRRDGGTAQISWLINTQQGRRGGRRTGAPADAKVAQRQFPRASPARH